MGFISCCVGNGWTPSTALRVCVHALGTAQSHDEFSFGPLEKQQNCTKSVIHLRYGEVWCERFPMAGHLCVVLQEWIYEMLFAVEPQLWLAVAAWHRSLSEAG